MTSVQHHIIRRQVVDVEVVGAEADGLALQRRLADFCQGWLGPALEEVLDRVVPSDQHWIIDRLEVDAGSIALETFERDLVEALTQAIARRFEAGAAGIWSDGLAPGGITEGLLLQPVSLRPMDPSGPVQRRTEVQSVHAALLHFLETGILPWWFHLPVGKALEEVVLASWQTSRPPAQLCRALIDAMASSGVRTRLVRQFSGDFLRTLLAGLSTEGVPALLEILGEMARHDVAPEMPVRLSEQLWQAAFTAVAVGRRPTAQNIVAEWVNALPVGGARPEPRLIERLARLWPGTPAAEAENRLPRARTQSSGARGEDRIPPGNAGAAQRAEPTARIDLVEGVYVDCAGLVLLHPFLPRLFEALRIAKDDRLVQPDRALCLLHFLATGERRAPEYELLLPKLLCNVPLAEPVEAPVELTPAEEEEALALLEAVIRHWDAVGETSVDGLRGTFLVRPGKVFQRSNGDDVLQVEARSFDILLDDLPWGIGMIQLPWMKQILWVEWRF